jgi:hypothetical protein
VALKRARIVPIAPKTNAAGTGIAKLKKAAALITAAAVETATAETAESAGAAVESSGGGSGDGLSPAKKKKKKKKTTIELPGEYLSRRFSELSALEVCVCGVETLNTLSCTSLVKYTYNSLRISVALMINADRFVSQDDTVVYESMPKKDRDLLAQQERDQAAHERALMEAGDA